MDVQELLVAPALQGGPDMSARRSARSLLRRGPPFVEISGRLYLNIAFEIPPPSADDINAKRASRAEPSQDPIVLRPLTAKEAKLVHELRLDADLEAWARITAP